MSKVSFRTIPLQIVGLPYPDIQSILFMGRKPFPAALYKQRGETHTPKGEMINGRPNKIQTSHGTLDICTYPKFTLVGFISQAVLYVLSLCCVVS